MARRRSESKHQWMINDDAVLVIHVREGWSTYLVPGDAGPTYAAGSGLTRKLRILRPRDDRRISGQERAPRIEKASITSVHGSNTYNRRT
eukprot:scaffold348462_cov62-Attheya_sp.AAC.2